MERPSVFKDTFAGLQRRIAATRLKSIAVCMDAAATLEAVRRARAARRGIPYRPPSDDSTFVPENRSRFSH
jgi:hypothetical protein